MNIEEVFFRLKKYKKITKSELYKLGIDDDYIDFTLEKEILAQIDENTYTIGNAKNLLYYGRGLMEEEDYKAANNVFDCAYEADMTDFEVNYQLFYRSLKHIKIKESHIFRYFNVVYKNLVDMGREYDANFYVLLLGNLYGSTDKSNPFDQYKSLFVDLEEEDILLPDSDRFSNYENMIRKNVFLNSYYEVNTMIDNRFPDRRHISFEDLVEKELLLKWTNRKREVNRILASYLQEGNVEAVRKLLDREDARKNLSMTNQYILKLANSYLTIKGTGIIPTSKYVGDNTFEAIDGNNYELALELEEKRLLDHNIDRESTLHMMLTLLNKITKKEEVEVKEEVIPVVKEEKKAETITLTESEIQSIDAKVRKLREGRMIFLLDPMSHEKRSLIRDYIKFNYGEDVTTFSLGAESERRVVLRYKPVVREHVDIKEVLDNARSAYSLGKYENSEGDFDSANSRFNEAAEYYELALKIGKPFASTYSGYGMTLYRLGRMKEAIDCLKVATIMSKTEGNGKIDFSDLIEKLENPPKKEDRKPNVVVQESEFEDKQESGLSNELINDIIGLTLEGEISLIDACKKLNLSEDDTNYIKLLYARDCYYLGNDTMGDKYFKQVEKCKKSPRVKELYKEVLANKKYYHNRYDENGNQLVFKK